MVPDSQPGQLNHNLHIANLLSRSSIDTLGFTRQNTMTPVVNRVLNTYRQSYAGTPQENEKPNSSKMPTEVSKLDVKDPVHLRLSACPISNKADSVSIARTRLKRRNNIADSMISSCSSKVTAKSNQTPFRTHKP